MCDLILQFGNQAHANRFHALYNSREQWPTVFPPGPFADAVEELSPRSHTSGPGLVQFSNMQLSPEAFNAWLTSSFVHRYLTRAYWLDRAIPTAGSRAALLQALVAAPVPQGATAVRLDYYPRNGQLEFGDVLTDAGYSIPLHPSCYSHVLAVVQLPDGSGQYRWSYMERDRLWRLSSDMQARFGHSVAKAINKLAEALEMLQLMPPQQQQLGQAQPEQQQPLDLGQQQQQQQPEQQQRWAIDVGACPGGWTSYLADTAGFNVIAIDPSQLHADVVARPNVHYIKQLAADALGRVDELLALHGGQADLLVCDANDHAVCVRTFLAPLLPKLKSGGWLIVTCKFYGRGYKADIAATMAKLLPELEPGRAPWLMANTLCERTYAARKL